MNFQDQSELLGTQLKDTKTLLFQEDNHQKDFSSVQKLVTLPYLRKIHPYENVFPPVEDDLKKSEEISPELKQTMIDLRDKLRNQFSTFEDGTNFQFTFPQSKFPAVEPGTRNLITYQQKNIVEEEDTFRDKLSPQQIQQISQNGQFKVRSNHQYITLPYIWKINDALFRGKNNIQLTWFKNIAWAHAVINNATQQFITQIPLELGKIKKLPMRLFSLFFGKKSMKKTFTIDHDKQIAKDFWNEVMSKYYQKSKQWGSQLWEYFDTKYKAEDWMTIRRTQQGDEEDENSEQSKKYQKKVKDQLKERQKYNSRVLTKNKKKQQITQICDQFERKWAKSKKKIFEQVSIQCQKQNNQKQKQGMENESDELIKAKQKVSEQQILQKFNNRKFEHYTTYLQKRLPLLDTPIGVIQAIVTMLTLMQIMTRKQRKFNAKLKEQKQKIQNQIKQKHKIRQYDYIWYSKQLARIYDPVQKRLQQEYMNKFVDIELIKRLNMKQKQVYNLWLEYRAKYPAFLEAKKRQFPDLQAASRTFHTTYHLFPPYKVVKHFSNNYTWYEMIKNGKMSISTDKNFWKLDLYVMRVKSWTINCVIFLIYNCWKGVFGLRCLWGKQQFRYDQQINYSTGQIINQVRKPVLAVFSTVLEGVKKSRDNFEALPDRGLFGKNFSRYFNYAQCYLFRFLFVGILLTLILYPIAIVLFSIITFVLILTVWAWMPIILLITYLFNTIFFQFQSSWIPCGFFIRAAPLLSIVLSLIRSLLIIILVSLYTGILAPIGAFFICLWSIFIRGFRTATDFVMLFLIRKLGRTPSRNTAIAKKISGPGMSKQYYMSINQQDVYILIQSQLQQILMRQYHRIFNQKVVEPVNKYTNVMKLLLTPYQSNNSYYYPQQQQNVITQSVNDLRNHYNVFYQNYMNRYPKRPYNIRFTQQQIDSYFENTVMIVKNFVSKTQIASWIFEEYHILQDYEQLTRKIWMTVFSCGQEIFEPLQKIDQRFKLEDMYKSDYANDEQNTSYGGASMKKNVHKVMQALQGEVQLKPRRANITAFNHNLMYRQIEAVGVRQVFMYMDGNSDGNVMFDKTNPKFQSYVNLAIQQIIKRDVYEYEWRREQYENSKIQGKR